MAYGIVKVDNITFDNGGSDQNVTVSGLYRATTSGVTVSGTIAAGTVSGVTVIGSTTVSGATVTGTTANFTSGNFSNLISAAATMSGALIMANQQQVRFREAVGNGVNHIALQAPAIVSADQTITLPDETGTVVTTGDNGSVTSTMILDGTIVNDDISASAAIADTKIAPNFGSQTITTTGVISPALGTAAAPSIAFTGDLNTGIFSPGADQVAVATNGVERVEFGNSEVVFNDAGADVDFRVEGDTNADLFKVDAGTDTVIVGGKYNIFKGFSRRPPLHRGPLFTKPTATTLEVVAGAVLNGYLYASATAVTIGSHTDNTDMAIWQHPTTGALVSDASFTTAPAGATGGSIVGGYHYIPSGRPTAVNNGSPTAAAEILEFSIWDLTWRPECPDPRGMACIDGRFWCDLYFCGSTSYAGTDFSAVPSSKIGLTIADENDPPLIPAFYGGNGVTAYANDSTLEKGCWYDFCEVASSFGNRLLTMSEFQVAAFGAPEAGSRGTDPGTVIWERASKWGLAQATGTLASWGADLMFRDVRFQTFGWSTGVTRGRGDVYQQGDDDSLVAPTWVAPGPMVPMPVLARRTGDDPPWLADNEVSARFAAEHLVTC